MTVGAKLRWSFIAIAVIPLLLTGFITAQYARTALRDKTLQQLESVASIQQQRIAHLVNQNLERLALVASRTQMRITLDQFLKDGDPAHQDKMNRIISDARASIASIEEISIVGLDGVVVAATRPQTIGHEISASAAFARGRAGDQADDLFRASDGTLKIRLSGPLHLADRLLGVIVIESDVNDLFMAVGDHSGLGDTGETCLVKEDNGQPMFLAPLRFDPDAALRRRKMDDTAASAAALAAQGREGLYTDRFDYRGQAVLVAVRSIPATSWRVLVKIDRAEAFAPIRGLRNIALAVGAVAILAMLFVAVPVSRSIVKPIRALQRGTEIIGGGNFDHRVGTSARDEVGQLARAFDDMVERLKTVTASRDDLNAEVAQRKKAERRLRKTMANLERSNRDLEQFAYSASHDLQEPLRKVIAFGSLLTEECGDGLKDEGRQYVEIMQNAAHRMQRLITDLLTYSRVTTRGKTFVPVDLNTTTQGVLSDLEIRIRETGARVEVGELPTIEADPTQMRQLLQNLIGNALKFHKDHESPHVEVYAEAPGDGEEPSAAMCRLVVKDNGIGFDTKHTDRIFGVFQRLHRQHEYNGSGIGLAVCRRVVERHGGTITVASKPGEGATFIVDLPFAHGQPEAEQ